MFPGSPKRFVRRLGESAVLFRVPACQTLMRVKASRNAGVGKIKKIIALGQGD
jgi:hypothetical protein